MLQSMRVARATTIILLSFVLAQPAWAVYGQQVVIQSGDASAMQGATLSFTTAAGEQVPVQIDENNDGRVTATIQFSGDRVGGRSEAGTLTVTQGGKETPLQIPSAGSDEYILVGLESGSARTMSQRPPEPEEPDLQISLGPLTSTYDLGPIGTSGVTSGPGGETFVLPGVDEVDLTGGAISLSHSLGGRRNAKLFGGFRFGDGDEQTSADVATMTASTALVFSDFAGAITGIGITPFGVTSTQDMDVEIAEGGLGFQFDVQPEGWERGRLTPRFQLVLGQLTVEQRSVDTLVDPLLVGLEPIVTRTQELDQIYYQLETGLRYTYEASPAVELFVEAGPVFRAINADLKSVERIQCAFCPGLEDRSIYRADRETSFSVGAQAQAGLAVNATDNLGFEFLVYFRDGADNAAVINPQSGDDLFIRNQPTALNTDPESETGAMLRVIFSF